MSTLTVIHAFLVHCLIFDRATRAALPPTIRTDRPPVPSPNAITEIRTSCDSQNLNVSVTTRQPFKGVAFAKDFSQECKTFGAPSSTVVSLSLPTSGCGVRLTASSDNDVTVRMTYSVTIVLQHDRHLRQITDQTKLIVCEVRDEAFLVKSQPVLDAIKGEIKEKNVNHRSGRMMNDGWSKDLNEEELEEELREAMTAARAWMEIAPEKRLQRPTAAVEVGETVLLTIKSTLPAGIGWRIVDCTAHDGLGDSSQKLLDETGCPVDEAILPLPELGPVRPIASMRHQVAVAKFAAFKFPDRDRLHLRCRLQMCRGSCGTIECDDGNATTDNRVGRSNGGQEGEILDRLEVYNSVEVIAPDIDEASDYQKNIQSADFDSYPFPKIPGDRTVCVSIDKMAIAFCALGLVFLIGIMIAVCSLLKSGKSHPNALQHYSRSLFSSSSSSGGGGSDAFGSKLLSQDSPVFGQPATNRMQYGRIL